MLLEDKCFLPLLKEWRAKGADVTAPELTPTLIFNFNNSNQSR